MTIEIKHNQDLWAENERKAREIHIQPNLQLALYNTLENTHLGITWEKGEEDTVFILYILEGELLFQSPHDSFLLKQDDSVLLTYEHKAFHGITQKPTRLMMFSTNERYQKIKETNACFDKVKEVELKDIYTIGHSTRVSSYAMSIALAMDYSYDIITLGAAATFHDLGKYYTPVEILQKPGRLSEEEFAIIKKHPQDSYNLLYCTHGEKVANIALQHHERMDGSGYPHGLLGKDICLDARIVAVADVFDAITSKRVYNDPITFEDALAVMEAEAHLYDPEVLAALHTLVMENRLSCGYAATKEA